MSLLLSVLIVTIFVITLFATILNVVLGLSPQTSLIAATGWLVGDVPLASLAGWWLKKRFGGE